jgi:hypothetical protein
MASDEGGIHEAEWLGELVGDLAESGKVELRDIATKTDGLELRACREGWP